MKNVRNFIVNFRCICNLRDMEIDSKIIRMNKNEFSQQLHLLGLMFSAYETCHW